MWDLTHGQIISALVLSYAYTFHWVRSNQTEVERGQLDEEILKKRGLIIAFLAVILREIITIFIAFFFSAFPFALLALAFMFIGSMINWLISLF